VRITAQLIDALKGHHLWAENYDREFGDIFTLQDDITEHVTIALKVKLTEGEQARIRRAHMDNPEAYEYFLRGREMYASFTKENNDQARKLWEKALELDPNNSWLWQQIGWTYYRDARFGWTDTPVQSLDRAEELALKTLAVDDSHAEAYCLMSVVYMSRRQHDKAVAYGEKTYPGDHSDSFYVLWQSGGSDRVGPECHAAQPLLPCLVFTGFRNGLPIHRAIR
jgi:adenylate cyclase